MHPTETDDSLDIFNDLATSRRKSGDADPTPPAPPAPEPAAPVAAAPAAEAPVKATPATRIRPAPKVQPAPTGDPKGRGRPPLDPSQRTDRKTVSVRLGGTERMNLSRMMNGIREKHFNDTGNVLEDEISPFVRIGIKLAGKLTADQLYDAFIKDRNDEGGA